MARVRKRRLKLKPSGRNPYVVATRQLGHRAKTSVKRYTRKGRRIELTADDDN